MIVEKIRELKQSKIKQYPCHVNRASELGHECLRYLVLLRTRWDEKTLHDVRLQTIFDEGNLHEDAVLNDIRKAGFTVIEQQRSFFWKDYLISGHIDAKVLDNNIAVPIEIKSSSQFVWQKLEDVNSLIHGKYHYLRKYPAQLTTYLLMDEKEFGLFLFKNKQTGQLKEIRIDLDYDLGERLIQKAEAINKHVAEDTLPDCMPYDEMVCGDCGFFHICLPEVKRDALEITTDPELEKDIKRWFEIQPVASEYTALNKDVKARLKEQEKVIIGNYLITGQWIEPKGKDKYWKTKIQNLEVNNGAG